MTARQSQPSPEYAADLRRPFDEAAGFAASIGRVDPLPALELQRAACQDLTTASIVLDEHGLTAGAKSVVLRPAQQRLQRWHALRAVFLATLEPKRADIDAVQALPQTIAEIRSKRANEIGLLRDRWAEQPRNALVALQWSTAQAVYQQESLRHGQRLATMKAYSPLYWVVLLLIGVAEWLINYDTFLGFTGVVAIAAGATIVLGVLLAFAAHGHGEVLKQWSYRFGRFQSRQARVGSWRLFALSTFAVLVVLGAAGGSRYAAVVRNLSQTQQPDLIGGGYQLDFNPSRDVLLSLLANVAAWVVGIFISYFCHDVDPEFMAAAHQHSRSGRAFFKARKRLEEETQVIQERIKREAAATENSAFSRRSSTETERGMLMQIGQHDLAVIDALSAHVRTDLERYRTELLHLIREDTGTIAITMKLSNGAVDSLTPELYAEMPLLVDRDLLEQSY